MSETDIVTILTSGTFATLLSGLLAFIFRNWISDRLKASIQHEYDQKLESHKDKLRNETEKEIVKLKADLEIAASQKNIKLTKVFENQAETVITIYQKLRKFKDAVESAFPRVNKPENYRKELEQIRKEFYEYFLDNKIYLPKETAIKVSGFAQNLYGALLNNEVILSHGVIFNDPVKREQLNRTVETLYKEIPELLDILEEDFREILGFSIHAKK